MASTLGFQGDDHEDFYLLQSNCVLYMVANRSNILPDKITLSRSFIYGRMTVIINIKGPISDDGFLQALQHEIDLKQNPRVVVMINSPGGDWDASLALGRFLRKIEASVFVMGDCYSSCVLILAAGVHRIVFPDSSVGIHRPYSTDTTPRTFLEAQRRYRTMEAETKKYLRDMNMPEALFEAMVRVPPESTRELTTIELERFGLSQDDPAAQAVDDAKEARKYGLTMDEYLRRKARREIACQREGADITDFKVSKEVIQAYFFCQEAVMQGTR